MDSPVILYTCLFIINVITFWLYAYDKHCAFYGKWRIPEAILIGLAVIGGAYGAACGMWLFRHKTRHTSFCVIIPICLVLWLVGLALLCYFKPSF